MMIITASAYMAWINTCTMSRPRGHEAKSATTLVVSPELKGEFERLASIVPKSRGTVLFRRGDPVSGLFLIRKGKVSLELDAAICTYPTRILGPGSVVGLPATVSGSAYSLTAKVMVDSELGYVSRQKMIELLRSDSRLCLQAMEMVSQEISRIRSAAKNGRTSHN